MKIIKSHSGEKKNNSSKCSIVEYSINSELDMAIAEISGREPINGFAMNSKSKEIAYVISGKGEVHFKNRSDAIEPGDVIIIEKNEPFYWDGNLKLLLVCTPAWSVDQYMTNISIPD